jgi:hypothetical protein
MVANSAVANGVSTTAERTSSNDQAASGEEGSQRHILIAPRPLPDSLSDEDRVFVNLHGDYSYLTEGYYLSLDAESDGKDALPTPMEALEAYVVPLALYKAQQAGLSVPKFWISNDSFEPPVIAYPINPFSSKYEVIQTLEEAAAKVRSLTLNFKYAFVCQALPSDCRIDVCRCIIGRCLTREYEPFAAKVFATFRLPLMRVHVIVTPEAYLFSAIAPLPRESLTLGEKGILKDAGLWTL